MLWRLIVVVLLFGSLGARERYGTEFTLEFSPAEWGKLGRTERFRRDVVVFKDGSQYWVDVVQVPELHYPFAVVRFSLDEVAAVAFSTAGDHTKMQVVTRNGQNYIGTVEGSEIDLGAGSVPVSEVDTLVLKQRSCVGPLLHERFHSVVMVNGDRFPVMMDSYRIQLSDGVRDFSIKSEDIVDVQFRGGLHGYLRGEALDRPLEYSYVRDEYLQVKLAKDDSRLRIPWAEIDRIRGDEGLFILTTPYHFRKWIPDGMVYVPGGRFTLGAQELAVDDGAPEILHSALGRRLRGALVKGAVPTAAQPSYVVQVPGFFVDKYEVTNAEYARFCLETGHRTPSHWSRGELPEGLEKHPVVNVSLLDAQAYAQWAGKRLPTEAEWERAAKGITSYSYPYGDEYIPGLSQVSAPNTAMVGSYESVVRRYQAVEGNFTQWVQDLSGNVAEWTASRYEEGRKPSRWQGPPLRGGRYVVRGGAYDSAPSTATTIYRSPMRAEDFNARTGFRCVTDAWAR